MEPAKQPPIPSKAPPQPAAAPKKPSEKPKSAGSSTKGPGLFSRLMPKFLLPGNQVHLPDDSDASIYYDEDKKRWVDKNAGAEDEDSLANSAPPSDMDLSRNNSTANFGDQGASAPPAAGGPPAHPCTAQPRATATRPHPPPQADGPRPIRPPPAAIHCKAYYAVGIM